MRNHGKRFSGRPPATIPVNPSVRPRRRRQCCRRSPRQPGLHHRILKRENGPERFACKSTENIYQSLFSSSGHRSPAVTPTHLSARTTRCRLRCHQTSSASKKRITEQIRYIVLHEKPGTRDKVDPLRSQFSSQFYGRRQRKSDRMYENKGVFYDTVGVLGKRLHTYGRACSMRNDTLRAIDSRSQSNLCGFILVHATDFHWRPGS